LRRWSAVPALSLVCLAVLGADETPSAEAALDAARRFGQALEQGEAAGIRPLLPERGKIRLRLVRLGPEQGFFSRSQVEALLKDFLDRGSVRSFEATEVEHPSPHYALAHARAVVVDASGHTARIELHLAFQPEGGSWVLREIRETPS